MEIHLKKAEDADAQIIFEIQKEAFQPLLEKYQDVDTNPANETIERVRSRISNPHGGFYKIDAGKNTVGAICVTSEEAAPHFWISPMFILPNYQGYGIAQKAITLIEATFPQAEMWKLATILEEHRNVHLYEKIGYIRTGEEKKLNECTTLGFFKKRCETSI